MDVFVGRQPILDRSQRLFGYELLFRSGAGLNEFKLGEGSATPQLVSNSLLAIGFENIVGGRKAFINLDRDTLLSQLYTTLPRGQTVLELLETIQPDAEVIAACARARREGYTTALDDYTGDASFDGLLPFIDVVKVDFLLTTVEQQDRFVRDFRRRGITMLAEKVETQEEFQRARNMGYELFQGYFFARPAIVRGQRIPATKYTCIQILNELRRPELDFDRLEKLIRVDVGLSFKLFRYVNSARFSTSSEIRSISHAFAVLGEQAIRQWMVIAALPSLARDKPGELVTLSLIRARLCELASAAAEFHNRSQAFLAGLFSLLDGLLDLPLEEALAQINVDPAVRTALLHPSEDDPLGCVYLLVRAFEAADWDRANRLAARLRLDPSSMATFYSESLLWAQETLQFASPDMNAA
jgi:EAL and modified HD-GYP domain-containing signal transduction protein